MCAPIFPNETHPTGRAPVHTQPVFPFPNCYHLAFYNIKVRVCASDEGWKFSEAFKLPSLGKYTLNSHWDTDFAEALRLQQFYKECELSHKGTFSCFSHRPLPVS